MEKMQLSVSKMLVWYDAPQLFTATDTDGNDYVCLVYDITEEGDLLAIGSQVSAEERQSFLDGESELGNLIKTAEAENKVFDLVMCGSITAERRTEPIEERMLPNGEYYYEH